MPITVSTQLYLCANQLHVSAIYNHHPAEQRTVYKKTLMHCNKIVRTRSRLKLVYICTRFYKNTREEGACKRIEENCKSFKYLMIFFLKKLY